MLPEAAVEAALEAAAVKAHLTSPMFISCAMPTEEKAKRTERNNKESMIR
jgi:hypothetical protein